MQTYYSIHSAQRFCVCVLAIVSSALSHFCIFSIRFFRSFSFRRTRSDMRTVYQRLTFVSTEGLNVSDWNSFGTESPYDVWCLIHFALTNTEPMCVVCVFGKWQCVLCANSTDWERQVPKLMILFSFRNSIAMPHAADVTYSWIAASDSIALRHSSHNNTRWIDSNNANAMDGRWNTMEYFTLHLHNATIERVKTFLRNISRF